MYVLSLHHSGFPPGSAGPFAHQKDPRVSSGKSGGPQTYLRFTAGSLANKLALSNIEAIFAAVFIF